METLEKVLSFKRKGIEFETYLDRENLNLYMTSSLNEWVFVDNNRYDSMLSEQDGKMKYFLTFKNNEFKKTKEAMGQDTLRLNMQEMNTILHYLSYIEQEKKNRKREEVFEKGAKPSIRFSREIVYYDDIKNKTISDERTKVKHTFGLSDEELYKILNFRNSLIRKEIQEIKISNKAIVPDKSASELSITKGEAERIYNFFRDNKLLTVEEREITHEKYGKIKIKEEKAVLENKDLFNKALMYLTENQIELVKKGRIREIDTLLNNKHMLYEKVFTFDTYVNNVEGYAKYITEPYCYHSFVKKNCQPFYTEDKKHVYYSPNKEALEYLAQKYPERVEKAREILLREKDRIEKMIEFSQHMHQEQKIREELSSKQRQFTTPKYFAYSR